MCGRGGGEETWRRVAKPIGDGPKGAVDDPSSIFEITTVNSPDRAVIGSLRVSQILNVELVPGPPRRLVVKTFDDRTVGSITSPSLPQLVACIRGGVAYVAEVLSIRGAICQVRVQRR